jgi:branched-chain amino acid transport system ATP-binding protein
MSSQGRPKSEHRSAQHEGAPVSSDVILETRSLTKAFTGFVAVKDLNLRVERGTIHAVIGPNGAGKSTCFNLLTKFLVPTGGTIHFNGIDITGAEPADVARMGLVRSFQISAVFANMTALQNVRVALQRKSGRLRDSFRSTRSLGRFDREARELLRRVGLESMRDELASSLSYGRKRALEVATTLALDPEMLLLDEPMAGMGHEDIALIENLIAEIAAERTVLLVEHNLKVVARLADRITVLARGEILAEGDYAEVSSRAAVREAYLGSADNSLTPAR